MKFIVISALMSIALSNAVFADTIVDCSRPPGGQIRCPDSLAAMCNVRSGEVFGQCLQPPQTSSLSDWKEFLGRTGNGGKSYQTSKSFSDDDIKQAISKGEFKNPVDGSVVRFKLPRGMR
jgi:hypothetical protein